MTTNNKPKLDIPVSNDITELEWVEVEFMFDEPITLENSEWDSWLYTVTHDGEEYVLFASTGLQKQIDKKIGLTEQKGKVVRIARLGTGKSTTWHVDVINGAVGESKPAAKARPIRSNYTQVNETGPTYQQITDQDRATLLFIAEDQIGLALDCIQIAQQKALDREADFDVDQVFRLGMSGYINATRTFRSGMSIMSEVGEVTAPSGNHDDEFVATVKASKSVTEGIINGLVILTEVEDGKAAGELLKKIGFISAVDIDENDEQTWLRIYHVVGTYYDMLDQHGEDASLDYVRNQYGITEPEASPF